MAFHVRDPETDALVRELARLEGVGLTEAVRRAVLSRLETARTPVPLRERVQAIQREIARYPATGLKADKAYFDQMSGD